MTVELQPKASQAKAPEPNATRSPLEELIGRMLRDGLDFSIAGLLDALWLAGIRDIQLDQPADLEPQTTPLIPEPTRKSPTNTPALDPATSQNLPKPPSQPPQPLEQPSSPKGQPNTTQIFSPATVDDKNDTVPASPLRVPAGAALPGKLLLSRALRPFGKWYANASIPTLDEEATVEESANSGGVVIPVMQPQWELHYELVIVADSGASMDVWQEALVELEALTRTAGVFRDIRRFNLTWKSKVAEEAGQVPKADDTKDAPSIPMLEGSSGVPAKAEILAQTNVRRLVLLVTNGSGVHWTDGRMTDLITTWSRECSVAVVQMLPEWMWSRTRTGEPKVLMRTLQPGTVTAALDAEALWWEEEAVWGNLEPHAALTRRVPGAVPILPLEASALNMWARMQMGSGQQVRAIVVRKRGSQTTAAEPAEPSPAQWERRVQGFILTASPQAHQLAVYLSASPFTLPVARLVQSAKLGALAAHTQLAEVLLSGLVERTTKPDAKLPYEWVQYRFHPPAADILRRGLRATDRQEMVEALGKHIEQHWGKPIDFQARIYDKSGALTIPSWAQPFADMAGGLLNLPSAEEAPDDGTTPVVFVTWESPRWQQFAQELAAGLGQMGFRAGWSGRDRVPQRGTILLIVERDPGLKFINEDHRRAEMHGLVTMLLLPPGMIAPRDEIYIRSFDDGHLEQVAFDLRDRQHDPAPPVVGAPELDMKEGLSPFLSELVNAVADFGTMVVYSNEGFDGHRAIRDLAWSRHIRMRYPGGVQWVRNGETFPPAPDRMLIFERPTSPPGFPFPFPSGWVLVDPQLDALPATKTEHVYEGNAESLPSVRQNRVKALTTQGDPPDHFGWLASQLRESPHLAELVLKISRTPIWPQIRESVQQHLGVTRLAVSRPEYILLNAVFDALPENHLDALGVLAAVRGNLSDFPPLEDVLPPAAMEDTLAGLGFLKIERHQRGELYSVMAEIPPFVRQFGAAHPKWPKWNLSVLGIFGDWERDWYELAVRYGYFCQHLVRHLGVSSSHQALLIAILLDVRWWGLRIENRKDDLVQVLPPDPEGIQPQLLRLWDSAMQEAPTIAEVAQRIVGFDFPLPDALRESARAYLDQAERLAAEPEYFVLVAGARSNSPDPRRRKLGIPQAVLWTAKALGRKLAEAGLGLICGVQPGSDTEVAKAFARALPPEALVRSLRLMTFSDGPSVRVSDIANVEVTVVRDSVAEPVAAAAAVVLLGGAGWVERIFKAAERQGKPRFAIPGTGEMAASIFRSQVRSDRRIGENPMMTQPIHTEKDANAVATAIVERIVAQREIGGIVASGPDSAPTNTSLTTAYSSSLFKQWEKYLDPATDSTMLFDWRKRTPHLTPEVMLEMITSPEPAERTIGFTSFWLHPSPSIASEVFANATQILITEIRSRLAPSLTELFVALGVLNQVLLDPYSFPGYAQIGSLRALLKRIQDNPLAAQRKLGRAIDVRRRMERLRIQTSIFANAEEVERRADRGKGADINHFIETIGHIRPPYGKKELVLHLSRPQPGMRAYACAAIVANPSEASRAVYNALDQSLTGHEDTSYGFEWGLRALDTLVETGEYKLTTTQWTQLEQAANKGGWSLAIVAAHKPVRREAKGKPLRAKQKARPRKK